MQQHMNSITRKCYGYEAFLYVTMLIFVTFIWYLHEDKHHELCGHYSAKRNTKQTNRNETSGVVRMKKVGWGTNQIYFSPRQPKKKKKKRKKKTHILFSFCVSSYHLCRFDFIWYYIVGTHFFAVSPPAPFYTEYCTFENCNESPPPFPLKFIKW
jgi:hypothetical protein